MKTYKEGKMRRIQTFALLSAILLLAVGAYSYADEPKGHLTVGHYLDWEYVSNPQISLDGTQIAYVRRITDKVNDKYENWIWLINFDGSKNRQLIKGSSPRWSPDGKRLAYIAAVDKRPQIFVRWMDSGEATQITHLEQGPSNITWSPDGEKIAFNMLVPAAQPQWITMPPKPKGAEWSKPPMVVERLNYRQDGVGNLPLGYNHIFVVPATGGTPHQLTDGDYEHEDPQWSPDGKTLIFSAVRKPDAEYLRSGSEVYALTLADGTITPLTDRDGPDSNPVISPDGKHIAYTGYDEKKYSYHVSKLYLMDFDGKNQRCISEGLDRSVYQYIWAPDNSGVYFIVEDRGNADVRFAPIKGDIKQVTKGNHMLGYLSISSTRKAVAVRSAAWEPGDLVTFALDKPELKEITQVNDDLLDYIKLGEVEEIWYKSFDGWDIQGWIVKPPDFDPNKKYPLILYIHGGPHAMYNVEFNFEFQNHAANGYVVLYTNPRGSTGYGQKFGNAIWYAYPKDDYHDLMAGVDAMLKKGYIDENNLFVCGGSGGGVLTSWIVGHTDRFTAAVVMKPVTNWYSFAGTTDGIFGYYWFKKMPWEDANEYLERSSISFVGNVTTPTMVLTGEEDLRTPMEQTEQYYRALKMQKKDTAMIRIQGEFHPIGAIHPTNKIAQILYLRHWFDKYMKK
jgi:dipeptidyl aminopeptidase/acylaminoacyl peptidase